jgi:nitrite reductase/ring-hydroxylating ferredoxin subunit
MRLAYFFLAAVILLACSNDRGDRNPYLPEIGFRFDINLNLPLYSPLTNTGNAVFVGTQGVGIRGVFIMNTGFNVYRAFEASCPNHPPNACSTMELNGQTAICGCDDYEYSLFTGQMISEPEGNNRIYTMLEYRASQNGNVVVISN